MQIINRFRIGKICHMCRTKTGVSQWTVVPKHGEQPYGVSLCYNCANKYKNKEEK